MDLKEKDKELLTVISGKNGIPIESILDKKISSVSLSAVDCLTGVVREATKATKEPE